jgi:hypothetical protein
MEKEELFKIIHKTNTNYTRNNNGVFINLAWLPANILEDLEGYVQFCKNSHAVLHKYESICDLLNSSLVHKTQVQAQAQPDATSPAPAPEDIGDKTSVAYHTTSSSMRYAMFKKRFAKQTMYTTNQHENDLRLEEYIHV